MLKYLDNIRETGVTQTRYVAGFLRFQVLLNKEQIHLEAHAYLEFLHYRPSGDQEPRPEGDERIHFAPRR